MQFILSLFNKYGMIMIFILVALEYSCFPLPSEIVLPFIGYMAKANDYDLFGVLLMSVIMGYLGCLTCYMLGYYGGSKIFNKMYNKFPSWRKGLDCSYNFFYKYGNVSVMIGRVIPMCRTYVSFFAGMFKQSLLKYSIYSFIGIFVWNLILIVVGYFLASKWFVVTQYYKSYKYGLVLIILIGIITFLLYKLYKNLKKSKTINGD